jgi:hypothetical protein
LKYPSNPTKIALGAIAPSEATQIFLLGYDKKIQWVPDPSGTGIFIDISEIDMNALPSTWALSFKIVNL